VSLPLAGVRVIDLTQFVVGPWLTTLLGDLGADVIKIERPGTGDGSRRLDRVFGEGMSSYFIGLNRSKRSIELDLHTPEGAEVVARLLDGADVLIANFRPGVMERLGLGYERLAERYPKLVYLSITAFGEEGPLASKPAMDIIVQAVGGVMGLTGEQGRPPVKVGAPVADFVGAYMAFGAVLLGLYVRQTQGIGQRVDVNLLDGQVSMLANFLTGFAMTGEPMGPQGGSHPQIVPYQVFQTRDSYIVVGCLTEGFWRGLCDVIGRPDLTDDPRFLTNADRVQHRADLVPILSEIFGARPSSAWLALLEERGVPASAVNTTREVVANPQVRLNGMIVDATHPSLGPMTLVGNPFHLHATPPEPSRPAPLLGEHTVEVLRELGYDVADIERLGVRGIMEGA